MYIHKQAKKLSQIKDLLKHSIKQSLLLLKRLIPTILHHAEGDRLQHSNSKSSSCQERSKG